MKLAVTTKGGAAFVGSTKRHYGHALNVSLPPICAFVMYRQRCMVPEEAVRRLIRTERTLRFTHCNTTDQLRSKLTNQSLNMRSYDVRS
jgi:hypothetical protein